MLVRVAHTLRSYSRSLYRLSQIRTNSAIMLPRADLFNVLPVLATKVRAISNTNMIKRSAKSTKNLSRNLAGIRWLRQPKVRDSNSGSMNCNHSCIKRRQQRDRIRCKRVKATNSLLINSPMRCQFSKKRSASLSVHSLQESPSLKWWQKMSMSTKCKSASLVGS